MEMTDDHFSQPPIPVGGGGGGIFFAYFVFFVNWWKRHLLLFKVRNFEVGTIIETGEYIFFCSGSH